MFAVPNEVSPKFVVSDGENEITNDLFTNELYEKNLKNAVVSEEDFKERVRRVS